MIILVVDYINKFEDFARNNPSNKEMFDYYVRLLLYYGTMFSPICVFLSVIFFTSQMAQRTEIVAILTGGVSFYKLLVPYIVSSLMLAGTFFYIRAAILPKATEERMDFEYKYTNKKRISRDNDIHKKVFTDKKNGTETYVYMKYFDNRRKEGFQFSMEKMHKSQMLSKMTAEKIKWSDTLQKWTIKDVWVRDIIGETEKLRFITQIDTAFNLTPGDIFIIEQKAETMGNKQLDEYIRLEEMRGSEILQELYVEKNRRFADPVALIILTLIGYAMSSKKSRGGTALQIGLGAVISLVFIAMILIGPRFVSDYFPAWLAVWLPNMLFFPFSLWLLYIAPK